MKKILLLLVTLTGFAYLASSQIILDDFNDGLTTGWTGPAGFNFYTFSETGGEMRVDYQNFDPAAFPRATYTFPGGPIDLGTNDVMRIKLRTYDSSGTVNLRVDLVDTNTYTTNGVPFLLQPIFADGMEYTYEFKFDSKWFATYWDGCACTGFWKVDSSQISGLQLFINYGATPAGSDSIWINEIIMDTVELGPCPTVTPDPKILEDYYCQQNIDYTFTEGFLQTVNNPDPSGINTDLLVGAYTRNANNSDAWGGDLTLGPLDFTTDNQLKIDFYNTHSPTSFIVVLQNSSGVDLSTKVDSSTVLNTWETLSFDFSELTDSGDISKIVLLIGAGDTSLFNNIYYMDNFRIDGFLGNPCDTVTTDVNIFDDFECQQNVNYTFVEGFLQTINNPDVSGLNTSSMVGEYTRNSNNSDAWGGDFDFAPLDFSADNQVKMEFWDNNGPTNLIMVLQDTMGNDLTTANATSTATGMWETVNFDFSSLTSETTIGKFVLLIGAGDTTLGGNVYYYDNFRLDGFVATPCLGSVPSNDTLEDFDCQRNITYDFVEGFLQTIPNPDMSGINQSPNVGEYTRNPNVSDAWGGPLDLGPIDLTQDNQLKLHFWNNNGPTNFLIVLQDGNGNDLQTVTAQSAATGAWEELNFDFSGLTNETDIQNIVLLIGAGDNTLGGNVYYLDNIRFEGFVLDPCAGVTPDANIMEDFDCQRNLDYQFAEGLLEAIPNPDVSGINLSATVGRYTRNNTVADAFGGNFTLAPLDFSMNNQIKMNVWDTNFPSTVICVLQDGNGNDLGSREATTQVGNEWEDLNFDFGFLPGNADVSRVVLLFDAGSLADSNNIYYFDNFRLDGAVSINDPNMSSTNLRIGNLYPNPANDIVHVEYEINEVSEITIELIGSDGKVVQQLNTFPSAIGSQSIAIPIDDIANGIYTIKINSSDQNAIRKFVKVR